MCYIACGGADAYLEYGLHCWDVAASGLIVTEAGGCIIDPAGKLENFSANYFACMDTGGIQDVMTLPEPTSFGKSIFGRPSLL